MIKDIDGYGGMYTVDQQGNIYSKYRGGRILAKLKGSNGYEMVHLSSNGSAKKVPVHRIVAQAFIPNPDNKPQVNHIDGDKSNNKVSNLEWATASENSGHRDKILWGGIRRCGKKKKPVKCLETGEVFYGINEAGRRHRISPSNIRLAIRGVKHHTAGGYHWKDIEE